MKALFNATGKFRKVECSEDEYRRASEDGGGICTRCGEPADGFVEPDAEKYRCGSCQQPGVYGLEQLLLRGRLTFTEEG